MISFDEFLELSRDYNIVPLCEEIPGDTLTPITIYNNLCLNNEYTFLLESAGQGEYSFIGLFPEFVIKQENNCICLSTIDEKGKVINTENLNEDLIDYLKNYLNNLNIAKTDYAPPFSGGFAGYFSYEMISYWESIYHNNPSKEIKKSNIPLANLIYPGIIIVINHKNHIIKIISNVSISADLSKEEKNNIYIKYSSRINMVAKKLQDITFAEINNGNEYDISISGNILSNTSLEEFIKMVKKGKEYIQNGDAFQIVLSQKFITESNIPPFILYRALRMMNPSPYLFFFNFPEIRVIGSSPEVLVKVEDKKVITRPLAGTRPRGCSKRQDLLLREELLSDEKERAEHIMLVDLGRNDLGRICKVGSVRVSELMDIELYSSVMHIVSELEGELNDNLNSLDVLKSVFPAGTVSGAPKIRAMEIIDELEKEARGIYAGAVGYIDLKGNIDTCIAIRTVYQIDNKYYIQAGAGIVNNSIPEKEYEETLNKAKALFRSLKIIRKDGSYDFNYR